MYASESVSGITIQLISMERWFGMRLRIDIYRKDDLEWDYEMILWMEDNLPDNSITLQRFLPTGFLYKYCLLFVYVTNLKLWTLAPLANTTPVLPFCLFVAHILGASICTLFYSRWDYSLDLKVHGYNLLMKFRVLQPPPAATSVWRSHPCMLQPWTALI